MKSRIYTAILLVLTLALALACKRDELDFDKLANRIQSERDVALPLVRGSFSILEYSETDEDSSLVVNGDTVSVIFKDDSLINFSVSDFTEIPEQQGFTYTISPPANIPTFGVNVVDTNLLNNDTVFLFDQGESLRIDSIFLNGGKINVEANNTFNHRVTLNITSVSLKAPNGEYFKDSIVDIPPKGQKITTFDISGYKIVTFDTANTSAVSMNFHPVLYVTPGENFIRAENELLIDFNITELNDFEAIFGFFGYQTEEYDTIITDILPDEIEGLDGTLNVTNPKIRLVYEQSFGLSSGFDLYMEAYHNDGNDAVIDPPPGIVNQSTDYLNPDYKGEILWNRNTVNNIDQLVAFPAPDELLLRGRVLTNLGKDSISTNNYALKESSLVMGLEVEIPLELRADLTYTDTLEIDDLVDDDVEFEIERADLHYWFQNYFPVGFDARLILLDTIDNVTMDTIFLNSEPGKFFFIGAPVDNRGNVIREQVSKNKGIVKLNKRTAENLLNRATHLIMQARLLTSEPKAVNSVRIGADSELQFQFGLDAKLTYTTY